MSSQNGESSQRPRVGKRKRSSQEHGIPADTSELLAQNSYDKRKAARKRLTEEELELAKLLHATDSPAIELARSLRETYKARATRADKEARKAIDTHIDTLGSRAASNRKVFESVETFCESKDWPVLPLSNDVIVSFASAWEPDNRRKMLGILEEVKDAANASFAGIFEEIDANTQPFYEDLFSLAITLAVVTCEEDLMDRYEQQKEEPSSHSSSEEEIARQLTSSRKRRSKSKQTADPPDDLRRDTALPKEGSGEMSKKRQRSKTATEPDAGSPKKKKKKKKRSNASAGKETAPPVQEAPVAITAVNATSISDPALAVAFKPRRAPPTKPTSSETKPMSTEEKMLNKTSSMAGPEDSDDEAIPVVAASISRNVPGVSADQAASAHSAAPPLSARAGTSLLAKRPAGSSQFHRLDPQTNVSAHTSPRQGYLAPPDPVQRTASPKVPPVAAPVSAPVETPTGSTSAARPESSQISMVQPVNGSSITNRLDHKRTAPRPSVPARGVVIEISDSSDEEPSREEQPNPVERTSPVAATTSSTAIPDQKQANAVTLPDAGSLAMQSKLPIVPQPVQPTMGTFVEGTSVTTQIAKPPLRPPVAVLATVHAAPRQAREQPNRTTPAVSTKSVAQMHSIAKVPVPSEKTSTQSQLGHPAQPSAPSSTQHRQIVSPSAGFAASASTFPTSSVQPQGFAAIVVPAEQSTRAAQVPAARPLEVVPHASRSDHIAEPNNTPQQVPGQASAMPVRNILQSLAVTQAAAASGQVPVAAAKPTDPAQASRTAGASRPSTPSLRPSGQGSSMPVSTRLQTLGITQTTIPYARPPNPNQYNDEWLATFVELEKAINDTVHRKAPAGAERRRVHLETSQYLREQEPNKARVRSFQQERDRRRQARRKKVWEAQMQEQQDAIAAIHNRSAQSHVVAPMAPGVAGVRTTGNINGALPESQPLPRRPPSDPVRPTSALAAPGSASDPLPSGAAGQASNSQEPSPAQATATAPQPVNRLKPLFPDFFESIRQPRLTPGPLPVYVGKSSGSGFGQPGSAPTGGNSIAASLPHATGMPDTRQAPTSQTPTHDGNAHANAGHERLATEPARPQPSQSTVNGLAVSASRPPEPQQPPVTQQSRALASLPPSLFSAQVPHQAQQQQQPASTSGSHQRQPSINSHIMPNGHVRRTSAGYMNSTTSPFASEMPTSRTAQLPETSLTQAIQASRQNVVMSHPSWGQVPLRPAELRSQPGGHQSQSPPTPSFPQLQELPVQGSSRPSAVPASQHSSSSHQRQVSAPYNPLSASTSSNNGNAQRQGIPPQGRSNASPAPPVNPLAIPSHHRQASASRNALSTSTASANYARSVEQSTASMSTPQLPNLAFVADQNSAERPERAGNGSNPTPQNLLSRSISVPATIETNGQPSTSQTTGRYRGHTPQATANLHEQAQQKQREMQHLSQQMHQSRPQQQQYQQPQRGQSLTAVQHQQLALMQLQQQQQAALQQLHQQFPNLYGQQYLQQTHSHQAGLAPTQVSSHRPAEQHQPQYNANQSFPSHVQPQSRFSDMGQQSTSQQPWSQPQAQPQMQQFSMQPGPNQHQASTNSTALIQQTQDQAKWLQDNLNKQAMLEDLAKTTGETGDLAAISTRSETLRGIGMTSIDLEIFFRRAVFYMMQKQQRLASAGQQVQQAQYPGHGGNQ